MTDCQRVGDMFGTSLNNFFPSLVRFFVLNHLEINDGLFHTPLSFSLSLSPLSLSLSLNCENDVSYTLLRRSDISLYFLLGRLIQIL